MAERIKYSISITINLLAILGGLGNPRMWAQNGDTGNDYPPYTPPSAFTATTSLGMSVIDFANNPVMQISNKNFDTNSCTSGTNCAPSMRLASDGEQRHVSSKDINGLYHVIFTSTTNGCNASFFEVDVNPATLSAVRRDGSSCTSNSPIVLGDYADFSKRPDSQTIFAVTRGLPVLNKYDLTSWASYDLTPTEILHGSLNTDCTPTTGRLGAAHPTTAPAFGGNPVLTAAVGSNAGSGYHAADTVSIIGGGGSGATLTVASVNGSGGVTSYTILTSGSGYITSSNLSTSGGSGSGATVNITAGFSAANVHVTTGGSNGAVYVSMAFYACQVSPPVVKLFCDSPATSQVTIAAGWTSYTVDVPDNPSDPNVTGFQVLQVPTYVANSQGWVIDTEAVSVWGSGTSNSISSVPTSGATLQTCGTGCVAVEGAALDDRYMPDGVLGHGGYAAIIGGSGSDRNSVLALADDVNGCTIYDFSNQLVWKDNGAATAMNISGLTAGQGFNLHKVKFLGNGTLVVSAKGTYPDGMVYLNNITGAGTACPTASPCLAQSHSALGYAMVTQVRSVQSELDPVTRTVPLLNPSIYTIDWPAATQNFLGINGVFNFAAHLFSSIDNTESGWAGITSYITGGSYVHPCEGEICIFHPNLPHPTVIRVGRTYGSTVAEATNFNLNVVCNSSPDLKVIACQSDMLDGLGMDNPVQVGGQPPAQQRADIFVWLDSVPGLVTNISGATISGAVIH